jgi:hypothetical protein
MLDAHDAKEGGDCGCDVCTDTAGLRFNLEIGKAAFDSQLADYKAPAAVVEEIDQAARVPVPLRGWGRENSVEENWLLRLVGWLVDTIPAVQQAHRDRQKDGTCGCDMCQDLNGVAYNVQAAHSLLGGSLASLKSAKELLAEIEGTAAEEDAPAAPEQPAEVTPTATPRRQRWASSGHHGGNIGKGSNREPWPAGGPGWQQARCLLATAGNRSPRSAVGQNF